MLLQTHQSFAHELRCICTNNSNKNRKKKKSNTNRMLFIFIATTLNGHWQSLSDYNRNSQNQSGETMTARHLLIYAMRCTMWKIQRTQFYFIFLLNMSVDIAFDRWFRSNWYSISFIWICIWYAKDRNYWCHCYFD